MRQWIGHGSVRDLSERAVFGPNFVAMQTVEASSGGEFIASSVCRCLVALAGLADLSRDDAPAGGGRAGGRGRGVALIMGARPWQGGADLVRRFWLCIVGKVVSLTGLRR